MSVNYESDARQELKAKGYSGAEIAKTLGIRKQRISEWLNGVRKPEENNRLLIFRAYGIEPAKWDRNTPDIIPDRLESSDGYDPTQTPIFDHRIGNLESVRADIGRLETALAKGVDPKFLGTISNSLRNYRLAEAKLLGDLEDTENGWTKTGSFLALCDRVYEALKPYPEALSAVVRAFET